MRQSANQEAADLAVQSFRGQYTRCRSGMKFRTEVRQQHGLIEVPVAEGLGHGERCFSDRKLRAYFTAGYCGLLAPSPSRIPKLMYYIVMYIILYITVQETL